MSLKNSHLKSKHSAVPKNKNNYKKFFFVHSIKMLNPPLKYSNPSSEEPNYLQKG